MYNQRRPFRVERMRLNACDTSRQPLPLSHCSKQELKDSAELEAHVNWVVTDDIPPTLSLEEIQSATLSDPILKAIYDALNKQNSLDDPKFNQYKNIANELSIARGVIL